jgi:hypothetical protein
VIDAQKFFRLGLNAINKLEVVLSSQSKSPVPPLEIWATVVLPHYWPSIGENQLKIMAFRCMSTIYYGEREIAMLLEHAAVPIGHVNLTNYSKWFSREEVSIHFYIKKISNWFVQNIIGISTELYELYDTFYEGQNVCYQLSHVPCHGIMSRKWSTTNKFRLRIGLWKRLSDPRTEAF